MKRCPSCQRTFPDDAPNFCPIDGQRLVNEESATFDPEKTVMTQGRNPGETPKAAATPTEPPQPPPTPSGLQPPTPPPTAGPQGEQTPPQQQWQPQAGNQFQQQGWQPQPPTNAPPSQTPPAWGAPFQQPPAAAPYAAPFFAPASVERSRALAIAALVCGVDAATIMALTIIRTRDFARIVLWALPILGIGLGVAALILALKKPSRFGGVELAIAGLALGVAGLVYVLLNRF